MRYSGIISRLIATIIVHGFASIFCHAWTPIVVRSITDLGPQLSPGVTNISRDGGYSVLINGNIVWVYDDTECFNTDGDQLSFISNTAAFASQPNKDLSSVQDFGVSVTGQNEHGTDMYAILTGWIPFQHDELDFNKVKKGIERVAICTGVGLRWLWS